MKFEAFFGEEVERAIFFQTPTQNETWYFFGQSQNNDAIAVGMTSLKITSKALIDDKNRKLFLFSKRLHTKVVSKMAAPVVTYVHVTTNVDDDEDRR